MSLNDIETKGYVVISNFLSIPEITELIEDYSKNNKIEIKKKIGRAHV